MLGTWTLMALTTGAELRCAPLIPGCPLFEATVTWPRLRGGTRIRSGWTATPHDTLQALERALADDAAREMLESGAA